jgi:hypothetical protein
MTLQGVAASENITYDGDSGTLWVVDSEPWRLIQVDPLTGTVRSGTELGEPCYALAFDSEKKILCGYGDRLFLFDPKTGRKSAVGKAGLSTIRGMTCLDGQGIILGVDVHGNRLVHLDPLSGDVRVMGFIIDGSSKKTELTGNPDPYRFGMFGLTYNPVRNECYGSTPIGLVTMNPTTGVVGPAAPFSADQEALQKIYQGYVDPMIRIRRECNLTFLYTAILEPREHHLSYVLDSTQDETHSFIGSVDPSPSEQGVRNVWYQGAVFLSRIRHWEEWGLLKSAYVPIIDGQGAVTGIAGADVNISIIREKTRKALYTVFLIGFVFLGIGVLVAVMVSRRLIVPMQTLGQGALKAAAGSFGHQVEIENPRELRAFAERFNAASTSLKETLERRLSEAKTFESHSKRRELIRLMAERVAENAPTADGRLACCWFPGSEIPDPSGFALRDGRAIIYLARNKGEDQERNIRLRHDFHLAYSTMLQRYGPESDRLMNVMGEFFFQQLFLVGFYDLSSSRLILQCRGEGGALQANAKGELRWRPLATEEAITLSRGESIVLASPAAALRRLEGYRMSRDEGMVRPGEVARNVYERGGEGREMFIVAMVNE